MARLLGLKQLRLKEYKYLKNLAQIIVRSFGILPINFRMIVWGQSGNGKSSFLMEFVKALIPFGKVLYVSLEEGFESSFQMNVNRGMAGVNSGIQFADHEMNFDELVKLLSRKGPSPQFIIIDSVQYWDISYDLYKQLSKRFPKKTFIFISHSEGKEPKGTVAKAIRYDAGVKVRVEGFIAFVVSRYGGNLPYVIWKEGAKNYWGDNYEKIVSGNMAKPKKGKTEKPKPNPKPEPQPATEA